MILPPNHLALAGYMRPPVIAIGDSMSNGVRSLTIRDELAALSPVQQFVEAVGLPMTRPVYPREVLFDLEDMARDGILSLFSLQSRITKNAKAWLNAKPKAKPLFHDNLSCAGADCADGPYHLLENRCAGVADHIRVLEGRKAVFLRVVRRAACATPGRGVRRAQCRKLAPRVLPRVAVARHDGVRNVVPHPDGRADAAAGQVAVEPEADTRDPVVQALN